jgi:hypothetical protein
MRRRELWAIGALSAAAALLTGRPAPQAGRFAAAFALLWVLPALSWARVLRGSGALRLAWGLGLAFVGSGLATLLLHLIPGPFPVAVARWVYLLLCLAPALVSAGPAPAAPEASLPRAGLLIVVLVAALARVPHLGYSEFQGDEAVIMQRAARALSGDDAELFVHQKGPVEILTPMALWALTGTLDEAQARSPFALAGLLAVVAVTLLAARWFGPSAGLCAGALAAINGFLVAFGRIVQYQNLVVAMGALGLLALIDYARRGEGRHLLLSAAFVAYGLLAHYDAVLVGPAALWLLLRAIRARRATGRHIGQALLLGALILGVFYGPFVAHPMFERTFAYLTGGRLGGGALFHNSVPQVWAMSTFYNAIYYVLGLLLLVPLALLRREGPVAAWLYLLAPLLFYLFIVADPRTHVYTFYPGAAVLAGAGLAWAWERLRDGARTPARLGIALAGGWFLLCAGYVAIAYVRHDPEYKRAWPQSRHPLYPVTFETLPPYGHFGFPYRAGWKAVEALFAQGTLSGTYASNEEPEITRWYVRSGARTMCPTPDVYVVATHVQDEVAIDREEIAAAYHLVAQITVAGRPKIHVFGREPPPEGPVTLSAAAAQGVFDAGTTVAAQLPDPPEVAYPVGVDVGGVGRLLGYDLSASQVRPGGALRVTLYWRALTAPQLNNQVFVHLRRGDALLAQHDGAPACDHRPTSHWEPGEFVRDEHVLTPGADVAPGPARLYAGMYDLLTLQPLPAEDGGAAIPLTRVEVLPDAP